MNNTIKQYILELLEDNDLEIKYLMQAIDNNKINEDNSLVVSAFTKESLLNNILKVINKLEVEADGI